MLQRIGSVERIPQFLARVKGKQEKLMGFGHRVYRNYDPRARIIRDVAHQVFARVGSEEPLVEVAVALERAALEDEFFASRKLFPNCDFYSGLVYKAMGFEPGYFPVLFALARCGGWVAHWNEFLDDPDRRIARPHQRFVGEVGPREVPPVDEREEGVSGVVVEDERGMVAKM
ncbi:unnamed protein product [Chondrus crispus]|nr:unnamed protein product [Chondrus crispus]CDF41373.1 unnamed protein product [Chondrus crispus]|eukprot:XP_005711667.1 unnamed protein product [Chondrus crispus]